jgi:hypothetical protein
MLLDRPSVRVGLLAEDIVGTTCRGRRRGPSPNGRQVDLVPVPGPCESLVDPPVDSLPKGLELVTLDEWGYPIVGSRPVPLDLVELAERAAQACPRRALILTRAPLT